MAKLAVTIVLTVLVLGAVAYAFGARVIPSIGGAGNVTKTQIDAAFQ